MDVLPAGAPDYIMILALVASVVVAWLGNRGRRKDRAAIAEVREHVSNTHTTNLRDDLDGMRDDIRGVHEDVRSVRREVRELRSDQSGFSRTVREFAKRTHPEEELL